MSKITTKNALSDNLSQIVLIIALGGLTGLIYVALSPIWWLLFLGIALLISIFMNNKVGLIIIFASTFLFNWLFGVLEIIPKEITWLPDVIIFVFAAKALYIQAEKRQWRSTSFDLIMLLLLLIGVFSALYNNVSFVTMLLGLRNYFKYVLMFYILRNIEMEEKFYRVFLYVLIVLGLLQIPITVVQTIFYGTYGEDVADQVVGTLGWKATGAMAILMTFMVSILTGLLIQTKNYLYLLGIIGCIFPVIFGSGQFGFYTIPLVILICLIIGSSFTIQNVIKAPIYLAVLVLLTWLAMNYHDSRYSGNIIDFFSSPSKLVVLNDQLRKEGTFGRYQVIKISHQLLLEDPVNFLFGYGPGNASESYFTKYSGKLDKEYEGRKIGGIQYTSIILEFGFVGLILFLLLYLQLWRFNLKLYNKLDSRFWRGISLGYNGILFVYLAGLVYNPVWFYDVLAFPFWFTTTALFVLSDRITDSQLAANTSNSR
ncbi:hypothetical protein JXB12_12540 [candidate division KSB1 bacterium]|nr:hypothetical protein [candidate division KSB1 bacterium]